MVVVNVKIPLCLFRRLAELSSKRPAIIASDGWIKTPILDTNYLMHGQCSYEHILTKHWSKHISGYISNGALNRERVRFAVCYIPTHPSSCKEFKQS